jgi:cytochrome c oxidase subunit I
MPLQIGAPDVAFPRMNILSYYFFTFGGLILLFSFLTPGGKGVAGKNADRRTGEVVR